MIPEEAVNEAQKAYIALRSGEDYKTPQEYAQAMLEAAAPHMLAEAWDGCHEAGWADRRDEDGITDNPYRDAE